jgi:pimeloyl-ACP methyl ester carboxylesterase
MISSPPVEPIADNQRDPMIETRTIETGIGLIFDVSTGGRESAALVLMLHGFCVSRYFWGNQIPTLAMAGYLGVAPDRPGYSAGAPRPGGFRELSD